MSDLGSGFSLLRRRALLWRRLLGSRLLRRRCLLSSFWLGGFDDTASLGLGQHGGLLLWHGWGLDRCLARLQVRECQVTTYGGRLLRRGLLGGVSLGGRLRRLRLCGGGGLLSRGRLLGGGLSSRVSSPAKNS